MLARPLALPSGLRLANRLAKAAMSESMADALDQPTADLARLYRRWSEGGAGLLVTGNVMVDGTFLERLGNVVLEDDRAMPALRAWADAGHRGGSAMLMQIGHPGRQTSVLVHSKPVGPSAVPGVKVMHSFAPPRALAADEIRPLVARFVHTAELAREAGFDGVQIHGAHGYLVSQFLSPLTNHRSDEWGGPLEHRARFLLEIVRGVRQKLGASFTVAAKINSADFQRGGFDEDDALRLVTLLEAEGLDLLEISGGTYEQPAFFVPVGERTRAREAYFLDFARRVRAVSKIPLMVTGGFRSRAAMALALEEGALDLVGLARPLALEPDLPRRLFADPEASITVDPVRLYSSGLSSAAEAAWFWMQLRALARGEEPDRSLSALRATFTYFGTDAWRAVGRRLKTTIS
jgi:2,4-dienoyl-CoA reductase-like NADH-dependent reductase (Old Yellow Enzyme family)